MAHAVETMRKANKRESHAKNNDYADWKKRIYEITMVIYTNKTMHGYLSVEAHRRVSFQVRHALHR